jgi:hypothetical protein
MSQAASDLDDEFEFGLQLILSGLSRLKEGKV